MRRHVYLGHNLHDDDDDDDTRDNDVHADGLGPLYNQLCRGLSLVGRF